MATSSLEIIVGLKDRASGPLSGLRRTLAGVGQVVGGILGAQAIGGIVNGLKSMGSEALTAISSYERLSASMTSLVARELRAADATLSMEEALAQAGSKAKDLVKWVEQLAIKSPFDQEGVANAMRTALAYGFTTEEAQRLTQASIDFVAATGGTSAQMDQIALALGQMKAKGKLAGQEILQLTNAGVGVRAILEKMGYSLDDVSKGLVKSDDFLNAFITTMESDFGGAAERQSNTWAGLINTFQDVKAIGLREFFGGVFEAVQPLVASFSAWLQGPGMERLRGWGEQAGMLATKFLNLFQVIADAGLGSPETSKALGWLLGPGITSKMQGLSMAFQPLFSSVKGLAAAFTESGPQIAKSIRDIWATIVGQFKSQGPAILKNMTSIVDSLTLLWKKHGDNIIAAVTTAIQWISTSLIGGVTFITGLIAGFLKILTGDWKSGWNAIKRSTEVFADGIMRLMGTSLEEVRRTWASNLEALVMIIVLLWDKVRNAGKKIVEGLKTGISSAWSGFVSWFQGKINSLVEMLKNTLGIHSPSSVFKDIGKNMMAGMAAGLKSNAVKPRTAMKNAIPELSQVSARSSGAFTIGTQNITVINGTDLDEIIEAIEVANARSMKGQSSFGYAG